MIKLEKSSVMNFENAIRGMRNPMNSWDKSDSVICQCGNTQYEVCEVCCIDMQGRDCLDMSIGEFVLGQNDLGLAKRLCRAGSDHRKFLRQIFVSIDITAPLYWWKEFDTYKVGTTANSTSTMHKLTHKEFDFDDFSHDKMNEFAIEVLYDTIQALNYMRGEYLETKDKGLWYSMIQLLPSSYNQLRTCTMTYENLRSMYHARKSHKLDEWHIFCEWVESLPYAKELIVGGAHGEDSHTSKEDRS